MGYLTFREYSENDTFYMKPKKQIQTRENFGGIYGSLNCPMRRPTEKNTCFCNDVKKDSIWPQCKKYTSNNTCTEAVCCNSCDINKQNQCPF